MYGSSNNYNNEHSQNYGGPQYRQDNNGGQQYGQPNYYGGSQNNTNYNQYPGLQNPT